MTCCRPGFEDTGTNASYLEVGLPVSSNPGQQQVMARHGLDRGGGFGHFYSVMRIDFQTSWRDFLSGYLSWNHKWAAIVNSYHLNT